MFDAHSHLGNIILPSIICTSKAEEYEEAIRIGASIGLLPPNLYDREIFFEVLRKNKNLDIGEVGLDFRFSNKDEQTDFFLTALEIAKTENRIISLHVVRADGTAIELIRRFAPLKFIWHGFTGSYETAKEVLKHGGLISLGKRSFYSKDINRLINLDFLIESDMKAGTGQVELLDELYKKASLLLKTEPEKLEKEIENRITIYTSGSSDRH